MRYAQWKQSHERIFSRIALAVPDHASLDLLSLNLDAGQFAPADWPLDWSSVHEELLAHLNRRGLPVELQNSVDSAHGAVFLYQAVNV